MTSAIEVGDLMDRYDLHAFVSRVLRIDAASVIRFRRRADGSVGAWVHTPFDVLATRVIHIGVPGPDVVYDASTLRAVLEATPSDSAGPYRVDPGFSVDSAWRWGALPPDAGFDHVDDVPVRTVVELSRDGADVVRTHGGPRGAPPSLLDQTVLEVSPAAGSHWSGPTVQVPMRAVFAVTAMGFVTDRDGRMVTASTAVGAIDPHEPVRVRAGGPWARIDARFGSVFLRRSAPIPLTPIR